MKRREVRHRKIEERSRRSIEHTCFAPVVQTTVTSRSLCDKVCRPVDHDDQQRRRRTDDPSETHRLWCFVAVAKGPPFPGHLRSNEDPIRDKTRRDEVSKGGFSLCFVKGGPATECTYGWRRTERGGKDLRIMSRPKGVRRGFFLFFDGGGGTSKDDDDDDDDEGPITCRICKSSLDDDNGNGSRKRKLAKRTSE